jgi:hypothetical protein
MTAKAVPAVVEEVEVEKQEEIEVAPATFDFLAPNTWSAYYGATRYDFVQGKHYQLPADAYAWFTTSHQI